MHDFTWFCFMESPVYQFNYICHYNLKKTNNMQEPQMNFMAMLVATLIPMIMGFIYYHPAVFGKAWMYSNGFTKETIGSGPKPILYLLALFVSFFLTMFFWGWVTGAGGQDQMQVVDPKDGHSYVTFQHGVAHGLIFGITVLLPIFTTMAIFEKRKFSWAFVNWGYWTITSILMCGILSAWR